MIHDIDTPSVPDDANPTPAAEKPCAARLKHSRWCCLPDKHPGEHEYLARTELPEAFLGLGPERKPRWGDVSRLRPRIGSMIEFPRGDRAVIEGFDERCDEIRIRWVRGGDGSVLLDGGVLYLCRVIEEPPR